MSSPAEHRTVHPIESSAQGLVAFLATRDLDRLVEARERLGDPSAETDAQARQAISAWSDRQAVANLLMYPELIPADLRVAAVLRGLSDTADGYLRLAAAVGAGELADGPSGADRSGTDRRDAAGLTIKDRAALLDATFDLIATDTGIAAIRAASALPTLTGPGDVADLVVLLRHPDPTVRHNLVVALARILDDRSLADLLADRATVAADDAAAAAANLAADGMDVTAPAHRLRMLSVLPYLPDLDDWDEPDQRGPKPQRDRRTSRSGGVGVR